ncbi:MAG: phosphoribosylformylglycinamidine synthase subunit PurS [Chloroflexota bacterium]|jgi:phosphoribosylformylglycinamidine synthase|nr:phosphoribosylformylglycinamidine synthase subunit PurS [Chloroflexota bacterium]
MTTYRFAVAVMPKEGILDPQGRAVEGSLEHLGLGGVRDVRVGRRVELSVEAVDGSEARGVVERLADELLANPLIESWSLESLDEVGAPA